MTMTIAAVAAPNAPGRLGEPVDADALLGYLGALARWRQARRAELERLDAAALAAGDPDQYTGDLVLAMSLWQAIDERADAIEAAWDSGRADRNTRERISQLIWGRLEPAGGAGSFGSGSFGAGSGGFAISFVEACRLSDAIIGQLRVRLSLDPATADTASRLTAIRAQLERCRELADPQASRQLEKMRSRVATLIDQAGRGADVAGPVSVLESQAALLERDLIVAAGRRGAAGRAREEAGHARQAAQRAEQEAARAREEAARAQERAQEQARARERERAVQLVAELSARLPKVRELAARCLEKIADPPRLGIPDVAVLGPVPADPADNADPTQLESFLERLDRVAKAMDQVERAYAAPLAERDELRGRLEAYRAMATARSTPRAAGPDYGSASAELEAAYQRVRTQLWTAPCRLPVARDLLAEYQALVHAGSCGPAAGGRTGERR